MATRIRKLINSALLLLGSLIAAIGLNIGLGLLAGVPGLVVAFILLVAVVVAMFRHRRRATPGVVDAMAVVGSGLALGFYFSTMTFLTFLSMASFDTALR